MSSFTIILIFLVSILFYLYLRKCFNYWETLGVSSTSPITIFGDIGRSLFGFTNIAFIHDEIYKAFPQDKFVGIYEFFSPNLLIRDPELVGKVLAKDFAYFSHRFAEAPPICPLDFHLFVLNGEKWRSVRKKLVPIFSGARLKAMFPTMDKCAVNLDSILR